MNVLSPVFIGEASVSILPSFGPKIKIDTNTALPITSVLICRTFEATTSNFPWVKPNVLPHEAEYSPCFIHPFKGTVTMQVSRVELAQSKGGTCHLKGSSTNSQILRVRRYRWEYPSSA